MGNLHRIQWIDQRIQAGQYPNCTAIASQFEISVRQAARDIEYLRDSLGAPISYSARHNGYVYAGSNFRLPQLALSVEDKDTLRTLSVAYARTGSQNARRLADLFEKLSQAGEVPGREKKHIPGSMDLLPPNGDDPVLLMYHQLDLAFQLRRKVNIAYVDARHRTSQRAVRPYLLFMKEQTPYLAAYCELRQQIRVFSIKRIQHVETMRAGYAIPESFRPETYRSDADLVKRHPYEAHVHFPEGLRVQPYSLPVMQRPDGVLAILFESSEAFLSWLLAHPPGYRLLAPSWLRERLVHRLQVLMQAHQTQP